MSLAYHVSNEIWLALGQELICMTRAIPVWLVECVLFGRTIFSFTKQERGRLSSHIWRCFVTHTDMSTVEGSSLTLVDAGSSSL